MKHTVITIGRQYGSGGREIGRRLGELLGIKVYDNELLSLAAEKKGLPEAYLDRVDEKAADSFLYSLAMGASHFRHLHATVQMSMNDKLFIAQSELMKEIAERESAVFVGRCADHILRKHEGLLSIFIHADFESRVARICELEGCSRKEAEELIVKNDKRRINYYSFYTGGKWGKSDNYHMTLDSGLLGVEGTANLLVEAVRMRELR